MNRIRFFLQILNSQLSLNSKLCESGFVSIFGYFKYFLVFLSIFSIIYAEVMTCIRIFADFVFKVVSQLTRVIQPQNKRRIFQRGDISYISYIINIIIFTLSRDDVLRLLTMLTKKDIKMCIFNSLIELQEFFYDPDYLPFQEKTRRVLKIICDFF